MDGNRSRRRRSTGIAVLVALTSALGCTAPSPLEVRNPAQVQMEGDAVVWTTIDPGLGAVRYGSRSGRATRVAYPAGADRPDRAYTRQHRVHLLSAAAGDTVYLQVLNRSPSGATTASAEYRFALAPGVAHPALLTWTMIDVGFGDAHLLTMPGTGERVLVDAGERRDWPNVDLYLRGAGVTRLDAVMATHIHEDHIGGMVGASGTTTDGVLGAWDVGTFLDSPDHSGSRVAYDELLATLTARGIPRAIVRPGETDHTNPALAWDPTVGVEVLHAGGGRATGGESEDDWINNDSVVLRVSYGDVDLMFGGDAEGPVQTRLLAVHPLGLESEVLKVHHHGVADASEPAYLGAVNPRVGLIPITSYESYSGTLPSAVVLDRLRQRLVDVFASDRAEPLGVSLAGDAGINVTVVTDGTGYEVGIEPSRSQHWPGSETTPVAIAATGPRPAARHAGFRGDRGRP